MNTNVRKLNELENIIESIWNPDDDCELYDVKILVRKNNKNS